MSIKKTDHNTPIQELKDLVLKFRDEREWEPFHDPKNLAEGIAIEAAELMELFLWQGKDEMRKRVKTDQAFRVQVGEELADIINYCLSFANVAELDIATICRDKVKKAEKKYPIEKAKGNATKYTEL